MNQRRRFVFKVAFQQGLTLLTQMNFIRSTGVMLCGLLVGCGAPAAPLPTGNAGTDATARQTAKDSATAASATAKTNAAGIDGNRSNSASASPSEAVKPNETRAAAAAAPGNAAPGNAAAGASSATVPPKSSKTAPPTELPPPQPDDAGGKVWTQSVTLPLEFWEGQYLNAQRIGVTHYKIDRADRERLRVEATTTMTVLRGKQTIRQVIALETLERANGAVDSFFESITDNNGTVTKQGGSITDERLLLRTGSASQASKTVNWPAACWGPLGIQQLLWRQPMVTGQRRVAQVFLPQAHQVARITLVAGQIEDTTSPQGLLPKVLPIDVLMQLEKEGLAIRLWTDSSGHILKTAWLQGLNLSSYRISQADAEKIQSQGTVDLLAATSINVSPPLVDAESAARIAYRVESSQADPVRMFSSQSNQEFGKSTTYQVDVIVTRPQLDEPLKTGASQPTPGPECLASSAYIGSQDVRVAELAARLVGDERQPAVVALKLTEGVHTAIRLKNFSNIFDSAQDVASNLEGDCTEHAVLLAAVLRSRQVPSRIASGLVITPSDKGTVFLYHMWTEAWLGDRWLPLDATTGKPTHCGYIKFLETALEGDNPYAALLPVLQSLGNLKITVQEISR